MQVYDLVVNTPAFLAGGTWTQRGLIQNAYGQRYDKRLSFLQNLAIDGQVQNRSLWANLSAAACEDYQTYESDRGKVLLVTQGNIHEIPSAAPENSMLALLHPQYPMERALSLGTSFSLL